MQKELNLSFFGGYKCIFYMRYIFMSIVIRNFSIIVKSLSFIMFSVDVLRKIIYFIFNRMMINEKLCILKYQKQLLKYRGSESIY